MDWKTGALFVLAAALCAVSCYVLKKECREIRTGGRIYCAVMCILVLATALLLQLLYKENTFLFQVKRICLLSVLWGAAYVDYKEYRIPNRYILLGLIYRGILLLLEFFTERADLKVTLLSEIIAAAALLLAAGLCRLCIKNAVGMGDIKLFVVMGLLLGLNGIWSAVFLSLIASFVTAVYLLIRKKKSRKDSIPFGPAIAAGTFVSVWLTGM